MGAHYFITFKINCFKNKTINMKRVGILGYGHLGKYLCDRILADTKNFELIFVWNRSPITDTDLDKKYILGDLNDFPKYKVDVIIEVAHPIISQQFGVKFLEHADYMIGSPTALANQELLEKLLQASVKNSRKLLVPCGAFWGAADIKKMSDKNSLKGLKVTMKKHPSSLKLEGSLKEMMEKSQPLDKELILYDGPVRGICPLAPNNVNTMAVGALSAQNLGFDKVQACLVADPNLTDKHLIEIEVTGPFDDKTSLNFKCKTVRSNPALVGHVTGNQTYASFFNSLLETVDGYNSVGLKIC